MLRKHFSLLVLTMVGLGISNSSFAQVTGCTNPIACNYNAAATIDDGFCQIPVYYINQSSNLLYDCNLSEAVSILDQACVLTVTTADPFCANNMWDSVCQQDYAACCPSGGAWYIPNAAFNTTNYTPLVFACDPPANYVPIDETYAAAFASVFSTCFFTNWTSDCDQLYNDAAFGCPEPAYWMPIVTDGSLPVVQSCSPPSSEYLLAAEDCIGAVFAEDPFCFESGWDDICQGNYNLCATGCMFGAWYLPVPGSPAGTQPIYDCIPPPDLYFLADAECLGSLFGIGYDPCFTGGWAIECNGAYDACIGGCGFLPGYQVPLPGVAPDDVVIPLCAGIDGYVSLDFPTVYGVYAQDASCYFSWDQECWDIAAEQFGCDNIGWYISNSDVPEAPVFDCDVENATLVPSACFGEVIANDPFCFETVWDQFCQNALDDCVNGCTYPFACNYSPNAIKEDQTCEFPGCTDPTALNYLVYAGCDDGSCVFSTGTTCMGDLNDDGTVNVVDLTNFLAVFGSVCSD